MHHLNATRRGLSLIEALIALAVVGLGLVAMLQLHATLRLHGDLARQRTEALRLAQDEVEHARAYSVLDTAAGQSAYADLVTWPSEDLVGANATFTRRRVVGADDGAEAAGAARHKWLAVEVAWRDRAGDDQAVRLHTAVHGSAPELAATVALAAEAAPVRRPLARHHAIPLQAQDLGHGQSAFVPPGQSATPRVAWRFDNASGLITPCTTSATESTALTPEQLECGTDTAQLVSGYVRYATLDRQPEAADLVDPQGPWIPARPSVRVTHSEPTVGSTACFVAHEERHDQYFCAVPVAAPGLHWTGSIVFGPPLPIAEQSSDPSATSFKLCRYHASAGYIRVSAPLAQQNFAVIRSGLGVAPAYTCPTGGSPAIWPHQPAA
jgi:Tfp pilus assembly protein PilV